MTADQEEPERNWKIEILAAADRLGWRWFIEERLDNDDGDLIFLLGMIVITEGKEKRLRHRQRGLAKKVGRPRKLRSDMKPVDLFLRVYKLQEYFERTDSIRLSQREVIKLLIRYGEIPPNSEISHIEKQVSAGKKQLEEMRREIFGVVKRPD